VTPAYGTSLEGNGSRAVTVLADSHYTITQVGLNNSYVQRPTLWRRRAVADVTYIRRCVIISAATAGAAAAAAAAAAVAIVIRRSQSDGLTVSRQCFESDVTARRLDCFSRRSRSQQLRATR